jgi:nitrogenase subunit NifH
VQLAEEMNTTVVSAFPESEMAEVYRRLALAMYEAAEEVEI